jgi:hypothetical protein
VRPHDTGYTAYGSSSPWVNARRTGSVPAREPDRMVPAPTPDPNFGPLTTIGQRESFSTISARQSIRERSYEPEPSSWNESGRWEDDNRSPWVNVRRRSSDWSDTWASDDRCPTAATVWRSPR